MKKISDKFSDMKLKKNLGQYFSGQRVSNLLAYLCESESAKSIIDPMCGSGDMLKACSIDKSHDCFYQGVEIDKQVAQIAQFNLSSLSNINIINSNAFDLSTLKALAKKPFDLVITNPPYIRYQSFSSSCSQEVNYLNSIHIRKNLSESLDFFQHLSYAEKKTARVVIDNYSGLSDMAVPSWILCALLVKVDGRIGMVFPNTWLSRDYSNMIQFLLQKWFNIEYIIEDGNSTWFPTAQVKTTLLIAKRVVQRESIFSFAEESLSFCTLYSAASSTDSLVGNISPDKTNPEKFFNKTIKNGILPPKYGRIKKIKLKDFSHNLYSKIENSTWYQKNFKEYSPMIETKLRLKIPSDLSTWLGDKPNNFLLLNDIGVSVSQGLRTGANSFFYLHKNKEDKDTFTLEPDKIHKLAEISVHKKYCIDVLRRQSELDNSYSLDRLKLLNVLLYLQDSVLPRDFPDKSHSCCSYSYITGDLAKYIEQAELINIGKEHEPKFFPELSAVKPNIRKSDPSNQSELPRFWYMIPPLTKRHRPELFIPRVNGQLPKTRVNSETPVVIDANFSTIWISDKNCGYDKYSILALLNSTWCVVAMEEYGTVMGGGALKLEAAHIKRLPIPILDGKIIRQLSDLGRRLIKNSELSGTVMQLIDSVILDSFNFKDEKQSKIIQLHKIKNMLFKKRNA